MTSLRRAAKVDANQPAIVKELRGYGYDVDIVHQLKKLYDLVVSGFHFFGLDCSVRVEVKDGKGKLTKGEKEYWDKQRYDDCLIIARCAGDVLDWFGDTTREQIHRASCNICE